MSSLGQEFRRYAMGHLGISSLRLDQYEARVQKGIYNLTPNIIEERQLNIAVMDVFSRLMMTGSSFSATPSTARLPIS